MTAGTKAAAPALALMPGAGAAGAGDYGDEMDDYVMEACFVEPARRHPVEGTSPETIADAMIARHSKPLDRLVSRIETMLESAPPVGARQRIYRIAQRARPRGAASVGMK